MPPRSKDYRGLTKADREWLERFEKNERGQFFCDGRDVYPVSLERNGDPVKQATFRRNNAYRADVMRRVTLVEQIQDGTSFDIADDMIEFLDFAREMAREYLSAVRLQAMRHCTELEGAIPLTGKHADIRPGGEIEEVPEGRSATS